MSEVIEAGPVGGGVGAPPALPTGLEDGLEGDPTANGMLLAARIAGREGDVLEAIAHGWGLGRRPVVALLAAGWDWPEIDALLAGVSDVETVELDDHRVDAAVLLEAGVGVARSLLVVPLETRSGRRLVACADPDDLATVDYAVDRFATAGAEPILVRADPEAISAVIGAVERTAVSASLAAADRAATEAASAEDEDADGDEAEPLAEGPHLAVINSMFSQAVSAGASDIHFTPAGEEMVCSMRVDGVLYEVSRHPRRLAERIVQALKQLAKVSLIERRLPQDGALPHVLPSGTHLEMRASFIPGAYGLEKVTLRIVDRTKGVTPLGALGLSPAPAAGLEAALRSNYGVLLVAGPTGSGKTTTLYAVLDQMNDGRRNILTVEDPVEITMVGVHQVTANPAIGLSFSSVLSRFLRADPDVMLVGEVRDTETAETAMQAAQTGHLVLSTIHTNSAAGAPPRLTQMGVEPYAIASGLIGILNQRLVRRLCRHCREAGELPAKAVEWWAGEAAPEQVYRARLGGCARCNRLGYLGRTPVAEMLVVDEAVREAIIERASASRLEEIARRSGMVPMIDDALGKVADGTTSLDEYARFAGVPSPYAESSSSR